MPAWYVVLFLYNFRLTIGVIMALRILACVFMFNVDNLDQPLHYLITIYGWKRVWKPARFQHGLVLDINLGCVAYDLQVVASGDPGNLCNFPSLVWQSVH